MASTISFSGQSAGVSVNLNTRQWANETKLLTLGDSLTWGVSETDDTGNYGYRSFLQNYMSAAGVRMDFVGDQSAGWWHQLDDDNGGVPGRTAPQLLSAIPSYINTYHPDVVLLLIGTNDIMEDNAGTVVPQEIRSVLDAIQHAAPGTKVFLAQLPPIPPDTPLGAQATANIAAVNAALPAMVAQAQAAGDNVTYVTMPQIVQSTDQVSDGVHLNDTGYAKMALDWFNALMANANTSTGTINGLANTIASDVENITGGSGGDNLIGDAQANIIQGGAGNDQIIGGAGADTLTGGAGIDWFIYNNPGDGGDTITDFSTDNDELAFVDSGFPGLSFFNQVIVTQGANPSGTAPQFIYSKSTGQLKWDPDGTGPQSAVLIATLTNKPSLTSDNFYIMGREINNAPTVATPQSSQKAAGGHAFTYVVPVNTFADADNDTLTLSATRSNGSALPSWLTFNPATGTFSGTPSASNAGTLTIKVTATDPFGGSVSSNFTLTTRASDAAPVLSHPLLDETAAPGVAFNYQFAANSFTDPDGDALTYSAALSSGAALPSWLTFNPATHTFSGTPGAADSGVLTVRVTANDGYNVTATDDFTITVGTNHAPTIANPIAAQNAPEDSPFTFVVPANTFADQDGDALTYTATLSNGAALPAWLAFNAATHTFSGTPDQPNIGTITVRVTVNDGHGGTAFADFNITTANVNDAPVVANQIPNASASEASAFTYTAPANTFFDQDGDALTYTATLSNGAALPAWLSFNPATHTFSGTPAHGDVGAITIRVSVSDGNGASTHDDFTLTVNTINHAPTVANAIAAQTAPEDSPFSLAVPANTFADSDGDTLTYSATLSSGAALPAWLTFNVGTQTFSGTPAQGDVGAITVRLTANDGHGGATFDDFTINIPNVNDAPVLAHPIPDESATVGSAFSYTAPANTFSDQDGDTLTYSAALSSGAALPSWLTFNPATRTFSGTPGAGDAGSVTVRVTANDGHGGSAFDDFALTTVANHAPIVAHPIVDQSGAEAGAFSFTVPANTFSDQDGDALTWSAALSSGAALPSWLSFNSATHAFSGTPVAGALGAIGVRVAVSDGHGGTVFDDFTLNVAAQTVNGTAGDDTIAGNPAFDQNINLLSGNDTLNLAAGAGHAIVNGGDGMNDVDTLNYTGPAASAIYNLNVVNGALTIDTNATPGVEIATTNLELLTINAGAGDDTIIAPSAINLFDGGLWLMQVNTGDGANTVGGGMEDDWVAGGAGNDTYIGSIGNDQFDGGGGVNTADYSGIASDLTVTASGTTTSIAWAENWGTNTLTNTEIIKLGDGANTITGTTVLTTIFGGANTDTIMGSSAADTLYGGGGADTINGGGGNDRIEGDAGADHLTGGAGNDTFVFTAIADSTPAAPDTITDFASGADKIDLSAIDADAGPAGDQAFALVAAHTGPSQIVVSGSGASWVVTGYVDGDSTADFVINVTGGHPVAGDFIL